jgi:hypothetical protein
MAQYGERMTFDMIYAPLEMVTKSGVSITNRSARAAKRAKHDVHHNHKVNESSGSEAW